MKLLAFLWCLVWRINFRPNLRKSDSRLAGLHSYLVHLNRGKKYYHSPSDV